MDSQDLQRLNPPEQPGVYIMRDVHHKIIYVGKAISLKKRLASYFRPLEQLDAKTQALRQHLADVEFVVTGSEIEALILECNLIKKNQPRYNILMRDDKSYPYLKLTVQEDFPRLLTTRKPFVDEARYFGPFLLGSLWEMTRLISLHFGLRLCKFESGELARKRPCLYAQLSQCDAVCLGREGQERYAERVRAVIAFLEGKQDTLTPALETRMQRVAADEHFELAARLRDQLDMLAVIRQKPLLASTGREDRDVLGLARSGNSATVEIFTVRAGNLEGRRHYFLKHVTADTAEELLSSALAQYYSQPLPVPPEIVLPLHPAEEKVLQAWLNNRHGGKVRLRVPRGGAERRLLKLAETNAWLYLKHNDAATANELTETAREGLADLGSRLGLAGLPLHIEGYDISNIAGQDPVGSQVVFSNGQPDKAKYRRYRIVGVRGPNDFAMLQEMLYRRFKRLKAEGGLTPDLVVVDGGAGQLTAALAVLRDLELDQVPAIGLAKEHEEIFLPGGAEPLRLPADSRALHILTRLRDEAHRFAVAYHRQLRSRRMSVSALDRVEGLGPAKRRALLRTFGSVEAILQVPETELAAVPGIGPELAQRIRRKLGRGPGVNRPFAAPEGKADEA
jgi:excinuclease ABC subunit C